MVLLGSLGVCGNWEFKVLSLWSLVGSNMINYLKHIYPWWIWLSHSIFINVGVIIILGWCLDKIGSLGSFPGLAYLVEVSYFVTDSPCTLHSWLDISVLAGALIFHISCTSLPSLEVFWIDDCDLKIRVLQNYSVPGSTSSFLFVVLAFVLSTVIYSKVHGCGGIYLG